jgi:catechol-2,3-dioxygenase
VAVDSVRYVILYVRDLDVSAAFYRDVVGLPFKLRDAGYAESDAPVLYLTQAQRRSRRSRRG